MEVKLPLRKSEAIKLSDNKKVKWKMDPSIEAGFLFPVDAVIQNIKSFCFMHNLCIEVLKSGFLSKTVTFLISGHTTESDAYKYRDAIRNYLFQLEYATQ